MRRILIVVLGLSAGVGVLGGCTDEAPTSLGGDLFGEGFQTFEVELEAAAFLERDTTYDRLGTLNGAAFAMVANAFEGELTANTLFRVQPPERVTWENDSGTNVTDTVFTVVGAKVTLVLDSLREQTPPVTFEVLDLTEDWSTATVDWENRVDTAGVPEPWTVPGGTTGQLMGSTTWAAGDTVVIPIDSAAAALWMDSAAANRGGLIRTTTAGARVRIPNGALTVRFDVRPESADTIVEGGREGFNVIVATPEPSTPDGLELRVGGTPAWRSAVRFRPLRDVEIPCTPGSTTCTVPLGDVQISQAALLLQPLYVAGRRIERPFRFEGRGILMGPGVPLSRSPLSPALTTSRSLEPDAFTAAPEDPDPLALNVTSYIRQVLNPDLAEGPVLWLALVSQTEQTVQALFGYAAFGSTQSTDPPRLRLMVTVPVEEELQ